MEFREATEADLAYMGEHSTSQGCFADLPKTIDYVYAMEDQGQLLGVGGLKMMNPTTAWVWMDVAPYGKRHFHTAFRVIRTWLDSLKGFRRLQASIAVDFSEGIRTVEHLGFHRESRMKHFHGDTDAYCYVRLRGE